MFSLTTEYALRVIVFLAARGPDSPATIRQIAVTTKIPESYLAKVLLGLARASLLRSTRGLHGGSVLTRDPADITVYDVVAAVDPIQRITTCPLDLKSHATHLCALHKRMDRALEMVEGALRNSTIAELLADPNPSKPLIDAFAKPEAIFATPTEITIARKRAKSKK